MRLSIHTIDRTLFSGSAEAVVLTTPEGQITVLEHHIPLITLVKEGNISYQTSDKSWQQIPFPGGLVEVRPGSEVVVLANPE